MLEGGISTCNASAADWRCEHENLRGHSEYYITTEISAWEGRKPRKQQRDLMSLWALVLPQTAKGWEEEKSLRYTRLVKVKRRGETKGLRCLEMVQYETRKNKQRGETKTLRCLEGVLYQSCESRERRKHVSLKIHILPLFVCTLSHISLSLSLSLSLYKFRIIKRKRKEADYIVINQCCCFTLMYSDSIC